MRVRSVAIWFVAMASSVACASNLSPGSLGTLRYGGRVLGAAPLFLLPPVADPTGNAYVLYGDPGLLQTQAFVGHQGGGWSTGCSLTKGDQFGAHGWSGYAQAREWYWSGDALVAVAGADGSCHAVLDRDPSTGADLLFRAVLPWVRDLSERTTLVALVQSPTDPAPFSAQVDLDAEILTNVTAFDPPDATNVTVVGVGGDRSQEVGILLVQYVSGGGGNLEARYFDGDGNLSGTVPLQGGPFAPYAVQGYLQLASGGLVAGLVANGDAAGTKSLVTFDTGGGSISAVSGFEPVGVHVWDGNLWLVGTSSNGPVVASISASGLGEVSPWNASLATANAISGNLTVDDDRSLPARQTTWTGVQTAMGPFPFLSPHALTEQSTGTTLWLFAGPSSSSGSSTTTAFAMAPVGVSYP